MLYMNPCSHIKSTKKLGNRWKGHIWIPVIVQGPNPVIRTRSCMNLGKSSMSYEKAANSTRSNRIPANRRRSYKNPSNRTKSHKKSYMNLCNRTNSYKNPGNRTRVSKKILVNVQNLFMNPCNSTRSFKNLVKNKKDYIGILVTI